MSCIVTRLHSAVKDFAPRGGSSAVEVDGKVIVFGGADREQTHFQDLLVYGGAAGSNFSCVKASGDVPMPRSGHAVAAYGRFMVLFGGIDFAEEAVFNDLYILDTDALVWGYVGESGEEVIARNSHSLGIVSNGTTNYLVLYGGASPEHGPLGDTFYAVLPAASEIDMKSVFVKWEKLALPGSEAPQTVLTGATAAATSTQHLHPGSREMHGTCCYDGRMFITGGRNGDGGILSDVWELSCSDATVTPASTNTTTPEPPLQAATDTTSSTAAVHPTMWWRRCPELHLPGPRCSHGAAVVVSCNTTGTKPAGEEGSAGDGDARALLVLVGGFSTSGISGEILCAELPPTGAVASATAARWTALTPTSKLTGRFGLASCSVTQRFLAHISSNKKYAPVFNDRAKEAIAEVKAAADRLSSAADGSAEWSSRLQQHAAIVVFGGVCMEEDFADLHLLVV